MKVYELFEVESEPTKSDCYYTVHRVYRDSLRLEAECLVDCMDLEEDIADEEYNRFVEKELKGIIETLKNHGRYPASGIPKYVAFQ